MQRKVHRPQGTGKQLGYSVDGGVRFGGLEESAKSIIIPQLEFMTNDTWEKLALEDSFRFFLKRSTARDVYMSYHSDDFGDLYHLPQVLFPSGRYSRNSPYCSTLPEVGLFTYDNGTALHSFS